MTVAARVVLTLTGLFVAFEVIVRLLAVPEFILPPPSTVVATLFERAHLIAGHALVTLTEIVLGLVIGTVLGSLAAIVLAVGQSARRWLLPLLIASQAIPVFAIAPLLTLWFGYGMASKIVMAVLIIFFPVTAALHDGLRRTDLGYVELARTMDAAPWMILRHIRLPAALPSLASGIRIATSVAPIGAVVGEWVGSSAGLGYLMLHANARMQTDLMFASLFVLTIMAVGLWFLVDGCLKRLVFWQPESLHSSVAKA